MRKSHLASAKAFLDGRIDQRPDGRIRHKFQGKGTPNEREGRQALVALLRSFDDPLDGQLRESLARLLDPHPPAWEQRKLVFAFRRKGRHTDHYAGTQIFLEVHDAVKCSATAAQAIADVAAKYSISPEQVKRHWLTYRRLYDPRGRRRARPLGN